MRSTVQPFRRNSALYRTFDDLILWLKFENNFDDSSFYYQQITGHNPDPVSPSVSNVSFPSFSNTEYYEGGYSAEFKGSTAGSAVIKKAWTKDTLGQDSKDPNDGWIKSNKYKFTATVAGRHRIAWEATITEGNYYLAQRILKNNVELQQGGMNGSTIIVAGSAKRYSSNGNYCSSNWPHAHCPRDYEVEIDLQVGDEIELQWGAGCCCGCSPVQTFISSWSGGQKIVVTDFNITPPATQPVNVNGTTTQQVVNGEALLVSGTGVFTTGPNKDSAEEFDLSKDFCFEFWAKFKDVPKGAPDDPGATLFDFGNLKLTNTSGFFTIHIDETDEVIDYYDKEFAYPSNSTLPSMTNTFTHYAVQRREDKLELWMGHRGLDGTNNTFMIRHAEAGVTEKITGLRPTGTWKNARSIGSTISGTNFFTGWMDNFKVWKTWVYGPEPVHTDGPAARGIYVQQDPSAGIFKSQRTISTNLDTLPDPPCQGRSLHFCESLICQKHDVGLWCSVRSVIDPRYSIHRPLPYEILWYWNGKYIGTSGAGGYNTNIPNPTQYLTINKYGAGELILKGAHWAYWHNSTITAVIKIGPPGRPKYIFQSPEIIRGKLKYHNCDPYPPCFAEGTPVLLEKNKHQLIESLREGKDYVLGAKHTKDGDIIQKNKVLKVHKSKAKQYYEITYEVPVQGVVLAEKTVKVTEEHPFYVGNGNYTRIKDLNEGDNLWLHIYTRSADDQPYKDTFYISPIKKKKLIKEEIAVYNLSVSGSENYFANHVFVHNKSPMRYPRLRVGHYINGIWKGWHCPYKVNLGDDVKFIGRFGVNPDFMHPAYPVNWKWINPGRGIQNDETTYSTLEFKNVRKGIRSPISLEADDSNGISYRGGGCSIIVKLPQLLCPEIISVTPRRTSGTLKIDLPFSGRAWNYSCQYPCGKYYQNMSIPNSSTKSISFSVNASDNNPSELNTGGLKYEWKVNGYQYSTSYYWSNYTRINSTYVNTAWTAGTSDFTYNFTENFRGTVICRVSYNNFPAQTYTLDSEGNNQCGRFSEMYFSINFPECEEPYVAASSSMGSSYRPPNVQVTERADGTEVEYENRVITVNPCDEVTLSALHYSDYDKWKAFFGPYTQNAGMAYNTRGYTNSIEITSGSIYDTKTTKKASYYNLYLGDILSFTRKVYGDDHGKFLEVKFINDCGERIVRWTFNVVKEPKLQISGGWNYRYSSWRMWMTSSGLSTTVNNYYQEREIRNWHTGAIDKYFRYIPNTHANISFTVYNWGRYGYRSSWGCKYYRIKANGSVISPWKPLTEPHYWYAISDTVIANTAPDWHGPPTLKLSSHTGWTGSQVNVFLNKNEEAWPKKKNTIVIEYVNNIPNANNIGGGDILSYTIYVNFIELPIIQTWSRWPRWGYWYCGYWNYGFGSYRMRWYRPYCYWWNWNNTYQGGGWEKKVDTFVSPSNRSTGGVVRSHRGRSLLGF